MTSLFTFVLAVLTLGVINAEIKWTCSVLEPWNVVLFFFFFSWSTINPNPPVPAAKFMFYDFAALRT